MKYLGFPLVEKATGTVRVALLLHVDYDRTQHRGTTVTVFHSATPNERRESLLNDLFAVSAYKEIDRGLAAAQAAQGGKRLAIQYFGDPIPAQTELSGTSAGLALLMSTFHRLPTQFSPRYAGYRIFLVSVPLVPEMNGGFSLGQLGVEASKPKVKFALSYPDHPATLILDGRDFAQNMPDAVSATNIEKLHCLPTNIEYHEANAAAVSLGSSIGLVPLDTSQRAAEVAPPARTALPPGGEPQSGHGAPKTLQDLMLVACGVWDRPKDDPIRVRYQNALNTAYFRQALLPIQADAVALAPPRLSEESTNIFSSSQHVMLKGPTGSGKSALLDAFILHNIVVRRKPVIYLAPVRALAAQYQRVFAANYESLLREARVDYTGPISDVIVASSGDYTSHDRRIVAGRTWLASIVTEKANIFMTDPDLGRKFLEGLGLVVVDEMHMISDEARGGVVDQLLTKLSYWQRECARAQKRDDAPRIVAVTTERLDKVLADARMLEDVNGAPFVSIGTERRPIPVDHYWFIRAPISHAPPPQVLVSNQDCASALDLDDVTRERLSKVIRGTADGLSQKLYAVSGRVANNSFYSDFLIRQVPANFVRVAFVKGSRGELEQIASQIKNARSTHVVPAALVDKLDELLSECGADSGERRRQVEWARVGAFLHTAEQPREVREHIEEIFRGVPAKGSAVRYYLLTTETLSYGVNLSIDCVVLGGFKFPRSLDPAQQQRGEIPGRHRPMRRNAFRNLIGRAGRKGLSDTAVVYVEVANVHRDNTDVVATGLQEVDENLLRFYSCEREPDEPFVSGLFQQFDIERVKAHRQALAVRPKHRQAYDPALAYGDFSYGALRAVLDAVSFRTLQFAGPTHKQLQEYLSDHSAFYAIHAGSKCLDQERTAEQDSIYEIADHIVERILESAATGGTASLLAKYDGHYVITNCGEAIISTGTHPTSIEAIADWLGELKAWCDESPSSRKTAEVITEAIVPGLVMSPDFWSVAANEFCEEFGDRDEAEPTDAQDSLNRSILLCGQELRSVGLGPKDEIAMVCSIKRYAERQLRKNRWAYAVKSEVLAVSISLKLCAFALRWVRGADLAEVQSLFGKKRDIRSTENYSKLPNFVASKHSDKLGWLTRATSGFFDRRPELNQFTRLRAELVQFSARLVKGLPVSGLPLAERVASKAPASRVAVMELAGAPISKQLDKFKEAVTAFYSRQAESLCTALATGESDARAEVVLQTAMETIVASFDVNFQSKRIDQAARQVSDAIESVYLALQADPGMQQESADGADSMARFGLGTVERIGRTLVTRTASWIFTFTMCPAAAQVQLTMKTPDGVAGESPRSATHVLTSFAQLALGVLMFRGLVDFEKLYALIESRGPDDTLIRVRDLAFRIGNSDFEKTGGLKNELLAVYDFEWDDRRERHDFA